jgi:hypothetical protein
MILDDENVLVSNAQEAISNPLNLIKMMRDDRGTFNRVEVTNTLFNIFDDIPDNKDTHYLIELLERFGWFIDIIDERRVVITEHPRKCNGYPGQLFEITTTDTDKGLLYSIHFYEYSCSLSSQIKSYMINKYKLIQVGLGWVPELFKHEWTLNF